jgi:hypothetical protein
MPRTFTVRLPLSIAGDLGAGAAHMGKTFVPPPIRKITRSGAVLSLLLDAMERRRADRKEKGRR